MKRIIFYLMLIVNTFHFACSQNNEQVTIEQIPSKYSTILFSNSEKNGFDLIKFYLTFNVINNTNEEINISFPEYIYAGNLSRDLFKGWRTLISIYSNQNDNLEIVFGNKQIENLEKITKGSKQYIFLTSHTLSQDSLAQSIFSSYLDRMKTENKDTLNIGSISELKEKNSPILKALEGDSIIISFDKEDVYFDPIPIQIK